MPRQRFKSSLPPGNAPVPSPASGWWRMRQAVRKAVWQSPKSLFWREMLARPGQIGAVCASSAHLARRMAEQVDLQGNGLIVELGGGTGIVTRALLARGVPPQRLVVIEQSSALADYLRRTFTDICVLEGDAAQLHHWLLQGRLTAALTTRHPQQQASTPPDCIDCIDCIVSGLPLLSIPQPARGRILHAGAQALARRGRLIQFTYALRGPSPWQAAGLQCLHSERVLANLPPARIDVLGHS